MPLDTLYNDESMLIRDLHSGSNAAFKFIFDSLYHSLLRYIVYFVNDDDAAEDIIQDTFVVLWQKKEELKSLKSIGAYLYTVAKNKSLDHLRKIKVISKNGKELNFLVEMSEPDATVKLQRNDLIQLSLIAATTIPKKMRVVFELLYIEGFSAAEIAEKLKLSIKTVHGQKVNAIARIREALIKEGLLGTLMALSYWEVVHN